MTATTESHTEPLSQAVGLRFSLTLPCGHQLEHTLAAVDHANLGVWLYDASTVLTYWLSVRAKSHRCSLVSADNPMGLIRKR